MGGAVTAAAGGPGPRKEPAILPEAVILGAPGVPEGFQPWGWEFIRPTSYKESCGHPEGIEGRQREEVQMGNRNRA